MMCSPHCYPFYEVSPGSMSTAPFPTGKEKIEKRGQVLLSIHISTAHL